jgi:hypothetical protein
MIPIEARHVIIHPQSLGEVFKSMKITIQDECRLSTLSTDWLTGTVRDRDRHKLKKLRVDITGNVGLINVSSETDI